MRQFDCNEIGCCGALLVAHDDEQLQRALYDHVARFHPEAVDSLTPEITRALDETVHRVALTV